MVKVHWSCNRFFVESLCHYPMGIFCTLEVANSLIALYRRGHIVTIKKSSMVRKRKVANLANFGALFLAKMIP